jgi:hypothetical protein
LVAAAINLIIIPFLPPHYSAVNLSMVACFAWLAWADVRPHANRVHFYLLLSGATIATAVGSIAAERSDGMLYTFLGLCLIVGFIANLGKSNSRQPRN